MIIPTEPIGSIPRPPALINQIASIGDHVHPSLDPLYDDAIRDTIARFEETGSPVITDGEQRKYHNFWTYSVDGLENTAPDGFKIPFAAGHVRRMPRLTKGPFRYRMQADRFLDFAKRYTGTPLKQAVISPSALSLMYFSGCAVRTIRSIIAMHSPVSGNMAQNAVPTSSSLFLPTRRQYTELA